MAAVILENEEDVKNERFDSLDDMSQDSNDSMEPSQEVTQASNEPEAVPDK